MTRAIETSLTLVDPARDVLVDASVFADPGRHFPIRNPVVGSALRDAARRDAPRRQFKVGGPSVCTEVEFFVLDVWRDKEINRKLTRIIDDGFLDAVNHTIKTTYGTAQGLLGPDATTALDAVSEMIELRRFIANTAARKQGRSELLFHHADEHGRA